MGLSFGRRNVEDVDDAPRSLNRRLMREIASAGDKGLTCSVEAVAPKGGGSARFYLYDGGVYAVRLDGYAPRVMDRMRASGDLDAARWQRLVDEVGDNRADPRAGVTAVEEDWISEDTLAILHREYVVACAGAVLVLPKVRLHLHKGDVTSDYCSLPLEPARLFRVVEGRTRRLNAEWEALSRTGTPSTVSLSRTAQPLPDKLSSPEFSAMLSVIDSTRSVDAVAEEFGMTRLEAVHAATLLAEAGVVVAHADAGVHVPSDRLMVPEHFGAHVDPTSAVRAPAARPAAPATPVETHARISFPERPAPPPVPVVAVAVPEPETAQQRAERLAREAQLAQEQVQAAVAAGELERAAEEAAERVLAQARAEALALAAEDAQERERAAAEAEERVRAASDADERERASAELEELERALRESEARAEQLRERLRQAQDRPGAGSSL